MSHPSQPELAGVAVGRNRAYILALGQILSSRPQTLQPFWTQLYHQRETLLLAR